MNLTKKKILLIVAFMALSFFLTTYLFFRFNALKNRSHPRVNSSDFYQGYINRVTTNRGTIYINLKSNKQFSTTDTRNYDYKPYFLDNFLSKGDSIVKPANSDTLYVLRGNKRYYFVLGKFINKPHR